MSEFMEYDFCANCSIYDWPQVSDKSKLMRCSRCKFISYCSKECQQEHWVKVHSQHCKYMSKQNEMPMTKHDPATCPGCRRQAEVGLLEMSQDDNPCLGCPWSFFFVPHMIKPDARNEGLMFSSVPLPFPLGEISGQFLNKAEHTTSILHHLLHKLKLTKHPAWTIHPGTSDQLETWVSRIRLCIWLTCVNGIPNDLENSIPSEVKSMLDNLRGLADDIDKMLGLVKFRDQTVLRLWDTFKLLLNLLNQQLKDVTRRNAIRIGIPDMHPDDLKHMVSPTLYSDAWSKVLDSMSGNLVPFTDLLKILCGGDLRQNCYGCSKGFFVSHLHNCRIGVPFIHYSFIKAYVCGDPVCFEKANALDAKVYAMCKKISCAAVENICHNCFQVSSSSVHRCTGCKTKYYCGVECRNEDWTKVHRLLCKKDQERKMKGGKQVRKQKGTEMVDEFVKNFP